MISLHKYAKWFVSFRTSKAYHLFALHAYMYWYIHKQVPGKPWKRRTRIGPFEYEYTEYKYKGKQ